MKMENNLIKIKPIGRKKFFSRISKGFMGLIIVSSLPARLLSNTKKHEIRINPLAVKREKDKIKNG